MSLIQPQDIWLVPVSGVAIMWGATAMHVRHRLLVTAVLLVTALIIGLNYGWKRALLHLSIAGGLLGYGYILAKKLDNNQQ